MTDVAAGDLIFHYADKHIRAQSRAVAPVVAADRPYLPFIEKSSLWPTHTVSTLAHSLGGTFVGIKISPGGTIHMIGPPPPSMLHTEFISFEGITFHP